MAQFKQEPIVSLLLCFVCGIGSILGMKRFADFLNHKGKQDFGIVDAILVWLLGCIGAFITFDKYSKAINEVRGEAGLPEVEVGVLGKIFPFVGIYQMQSMINEYVDSVEGQSSAAQ